MATPAPALAAPVRGIDTPHVPAPAALMQRSPAPDRWLWWGLLIAAAALIGGVMATGVSPRYFLQPTGMLIVLGGTAGVTLISTPRGALAGALRSLRVLANAESVDRRALLEELLALNRIRRAKGLWVLDIESNTASHPFLRDLLLAAVDAPGRADFQAAIESRIRVEERRSDTGAKALEVAGGFAPALGVMGTVVGLIEVLGQFSNLTGVAGGIGTAFVSTMYGLALANLLLLPAAYRIRAHAVEALEIEDMIFEAGLCIYDGVHPSLMLERLGAFLTPSANPSPKPGVAG
ncbi:MAG TPA: MotA/TolQ/ExbB proton channel family protein [Bryobacteraceae bacterium]|nr:MotA/TolQ/ExbB proton channel family protein [Bryobacteraceae bacterium]